MARISKLLAAYVNQARAAGTIEETSPIKVVARLSTQPTSSILRAPMGADGRSRALAQMAGAGLGGIRASVSSASPASVVAGSPAITLELENREIDRLAETDGVEYVRMMRVHKLHLDKGPGLLGVDATVRSRYTGAGITVAIIDSGIDATHPDLAGRVLTDKSRNFTSEGDEDDISDLNGHGTHVAGIVGGAGSTYKGVATDVKFIACKVFDKDGRAEEGSVVAGVRWAVDQGAHVINYSGGYAPVFQQIPLVKPPWVWPAELIEEEIEFQRADEHGICGVVSAGNEGAFGRRGTLSMPATAPSVISVGSVDKGLDLSGFSSVGPSLRSDRVDPIDFVDHLSDELRPHTRSMPKVDLVAPGGEVDQLAAMAGGCFYLPGIISAQTTQAAGDEACGVGELYARASGTSQAAPHVAGLCALILEAMGSKGLDFGVRKAQVTKAILLSASNRLDGFNKNEQGRGLPAWERIEEIIDVIAAGTIDPDAMV